MVQNYLLSGHRDTGTKAVWALSINLLPEHSGSLPYHVTYRKVVLSGKVAKHPVCDSQLFVAMTQATVAGRRDRWMQSW